MEGKKITIIIPAYRRTHLLLLKLPSFINALKNMNVLVKEVVIIAEETEPDMMLRLSSKIELSSRVNVCVLSPTKRLGKGAAVLLGAMKARFKNLIIIDADLPISPDILAIMYSIYDKKRTPVFCYRKSYDTNMFRKVLSRLYRFLNLLLYKSMVDVQCGVKVLSKQQVLRHADIALWGILYDTLLYKKLYCNGTSVAFIPVNYSSGKGSELDDPLKLLLIAFRCVIAVMPWFMKKIIRNSMC